MATRLVPNRIAVARACIRPPINVSDRPSSANSTPSNHANSAAEAVSAVGSGV